MKLEKLLSTTDFVIWMGDCYAPDKNIKAEVESNMIFDYAKLMKRPIEFWMFVPCYKHPITGIEVVLTNKWDNKATYDQGKERCWFEVITLNSLVKTLCKDGSFPIEHMTIHSGLFKGLKPTPTFLKEIGL